MSVTSSSSITSTTAGAGGASGSGGGVDDGGGGSEGQGSGGSDQGDAFCGGPTPAIMPDTHCATPDGGRGDAVGPHGGTEADDDNCLYHVMFSVPCILRNANVSLTLDMKNLAGVTPATGAEPSIEGTIGNHPLPNTNATATENNGVYTIGPVRFDQMGRWTITFHVYDATPAMHSHVSFFIDVP